jgi:prepilin-type N-terminal cleavage/methylation domain-containing protein
MMKRNGFTLIELLVGLAISSIVMSGIFSVYYAQSKSHRKQQQLVERQQNLRAALFLMERDIRLAGYDPTKTDIAGITVAKTDQIEFTMNLGGGELDGVDNDFDGDTDEDTPGQESDGIDNDGDGATDEPDEADESSYSDDAISGAGETISYRLDGTNLIRNAGTGDQTAAFNIGWIQFDYLDGFGNSLIDAGEVPPGVPVDRLQDIRQVAILLETVEDQNGKLSYKNEVRCRNLNYN